ncbi:MAG: hypothetical protein IKS93_02740 [Methanobrevibacter sp.]|nr:hypothetical protein [Methanobrevibacter sp.]
MNELKCVKCESSFIFNRKDLWIIPKCPRCDGTLLDKETFAKLKAKENSKIKIDG